MTKARTKSTPLRASPSQEKATQRTRDCRSRQRVRLLDSLDFSEAATGDDIAAMNKRFRSIFYDSTGIRRATFIRVPKEIITTLKRVRNEEKGFFDSMFAKIASHNKPVPGDVSSIRPKTVKKGGGLHVVTLKEKPKFELLRCRRGNGKLSKEARDAEFKALTSALDRLHVSALQSIGVDLAQPPDFTAGLLVTARRWSAQPSHMDFPEYMVCRNLHSVQNGPFETQAPYVLELPVYHCGMKIEIWPDADFASCVSEGKKIPGVVVNVPLGYALLFRGDVVHAGGFLQANDTSLMGQRWHFYLYPPGVPRDTTYITRYKSQVVAPEKYYDEVFVSSRQERLAQA